MICPKHLFAPKAFLIDESFVDREEANVFDMDVDKNRRHHLHFLLS